MIGSSVINYVDNRASDGLVVAATHGIGMYSANFMQVSGSTEPTDAVQVLVSPNPTNDIARFNFGKQNIDNVTLRLYDLKGRLMVQTTFIGGKNELSLQGLAAGVYFWELRGSGWRKSGKIAKN